jgi:hypothetical protein
MYNEGESSVRVACGDILIFPLSFAIGSGISAISFLLLLYLLCLVATDRNLTP